MSAVRLVATDLDGTLVRSDRSISERTVAALAAAEDAGVVVVFVTGRPLRWTEEVFEHVGAHGLAVISNGAIVWDVARSDVARIRPFDRQVLLDVCAAIRGAVPETRFAVEDRHGIALEPDFMERSPVPEGARRGPLEELVGDEVVKLLARDEELDPLDYWERAAAVVGDRAVITWSSTSTLLEISAAGVTKASTLALLCADLGISADEVVTLGDMPNDIPMLEWAGLSYAMANAHESVLAVADRVAASNDEDGVAQVLEEIVAASSPTPPGA